MNQISNPPNNYDFGTSFDYAVWTPGTTVTLCNVPFGPDYRDIVEYDTQAQFDRYVLNGTGNTTFGYGAMTYARVGDPIRIPLPFNDAYRYNYIRVANPAQPVGESRSRVFYYFITDVRHIAPNTTELHIQLDVWQTFSYDMEFGNCYVERGHVGIANNRDMENFGRTYLTQPEGLDIGGEYSVERVYRKDYSHWGVYHNVGLVVTSTVSLSGKDGDVGTIEAPILQTARPSFAEGLPNGCAIYYFPSLAEFSNYMQQASSRPWITQGIINITAIPEGIVQVAELRKETVTWQPVGITHTLYNMYGHKSTIQRDTFELAPDFRDALKAVRLDNRYRHLNKFLTYPYSVVEMTTYTGQPLILKPESIGDVNLTCTQLNHVVMPSPRILIAPRDYNKGHGQSDGIDDGAEFLDIATGFTNFPSFSVVNNGYMSAIASQAHSIAFQHQSADWSQQKSLTGNQLGYDQSTAGMQLNNTMTNMQNNNAQAVNALNNSVAGQRMVVGAVGDVLGGAGGGGAGLAAGAGKAAFRGVDTAITVSQNNQSTNLSTNFNSSRNNAVNSNAGYVRDTNKDYADYAAKGDYANTIGAINARVQDAKLTQPTTSGQIGGDATLLATWKWQVVAKVKMLQESAMHSVGEYWLRYGYAINRFIAMPDKLNVMDRFTYWRVKELYITSSRSPEFARQAIRGIFEKGVTVWENPEDIGRIDIGINNPRKAEYYG